MAFHLALQEGHVGNIMMDIIILILNDRVLISLYMDSYDGYYNINRE